MSQFEAKYQELMLEATLDQLTDEQYEEYKEIAKLLAKGKYDEFSKKIKIFKKKHKIK